MLEYSRRSLVEEDYTSYNKQPQTQIFLNAIIQGIYNMYSTWRSHVFNSRSQNFENSENCLDKNISKIKKFQKRVWLKWRAYNQNLWRSVRFKWECAFKSQKNWWNQILIQLAVRLQSTSSRTVRVPMTDLKRNL